MKQKITSKKKCGKFSQHTAKRELQCFATIKIKKKNQIVTFFSCCFFRAFLGFY